MTTSVYPTAKIDQLSCENSSIELWIPDQNGNTGCVQFVPDSKQIPSQNGINHGEMPLDQGQYQTSQNKTLLTL